MMQQPMAETAAPREANLSRAIAPAVTVRVVGAMLALAVAAVHVADQGGITSFTSPDWIGWGYRTIEAGGAATALALLVPWPAAVALDRARWAAAALLGLGPFVAYIASRSVGVPGDPGDVGNWGYWVGTVSLLVEAALIALSAGMLASLRAAGARGR